MALRTTMPRYQDYPLGRQDPQYQADVQEYYEWKNSQPPSYLDFPGGSADPDYHQAVRDFYNPPSDEEEEEPAATITPAEPVFDDEPVDFNEDPIPTHFKTQ